MTDYRIWSDFLDSAKQLSMVTRRIRSLGSLAMTMTTFVVIASLVILVVRAQPVYMNRAQMTLLALIPAFIAVFAISILLALERALRRGDALFEELTEELQFQLSRKDLDDSPALRAPSEGRLAMKDYSHSRALPFLPARSGPGILLLVNVIFAVIPPIFPLF